MAVRETQRAVKTGIPVHKGVPGFRHIAAWYACLHF